MSDIHEDTANSLNGGTETNLSEDRLTLPDILDFVRGTADVDGVRYFERLVKLMGTKLNATSCFVAFALDDPPVKVRVVAGFRNGSLVESWDYELTENPCLLTYDGDATFIPCDVSKAFPQKKSNGYKSFIGWPLFVRDKVAGHIAMYSLKEIITKRMHHLYTEFVGKRAQLELDRLISASETRFALEALNREKSSLEAMARQDPLTGLTNRFGMSEYASREFQRSRRSGKAFGILFIDLDHFKKINDGFGHDIGDEVLQTVASIITSKIRDGMDMAARFGGEEIVVLLPETTKSACRRIAEEIRTAVQIQAYSRDGLRTTCSIGVALLVEGDTDWQSVVARADALLYQAKNAGRNCVVESN